MPRSLSRSARSTRDEEFSAFVQDHGPQFLRAAILLTAGDTHAGEDLVQTALARAYVAWPRLRERPVAYVHRVVVNTYIDETRRPWWRHERSVPDPPEPRPVPGPRGRHVFALPTCPNAWLPVSGRS